MRVFLFFKEVNMKQMILNLNKNALTYWISVILFLSLYSQHNLGGAGYELPFNVTTWLGVSLFIIYTFSRVFYRQNLKISFFIYWVLLIFIAILSMGLLNSELTVNQTVVEISIFIILFLFVFSLHQYKLTRNTLIKILYVLCLLGLLQGLIAVVQVYDVDSIIYGLTNYSPFMQKQPLGVFQQKNMLSIFLVVVLLSALYILFNPNKMINQLWAKIFIFASVFCAMYVVLLTQSRAGLLSLILGLMLLVFSNRKHVIRRKGFVSIWFVAGFLAYLVFQLFTPNNIDGDDVLTKVENVLMGTDIRLFLYSSTIDMIMNSPLTGYGIGNYGQEFINYVALNGAPDTLINFDVSIYKHPHNELLFWIFQSGVLVSILLVGFALHFFYKTRVISARIKLSILAITFPLIFSSMVSLPFSLSSIHLFLLTLFIYFAVKDFNKPIHFFVTKQFRFFVLLISIILSLGTIYFSWHTLKSGEEVNFFDNRKGYFSILTPQEKLQVTYLEHASFNIFYREASIRAMLFLGRQAISNNIFFDLIKYKQWAEIQPINTYTIEIYETLYDVYIKLNETEKAIATKKIIESL